MEYGYGVQWPPFELRKLHPQVQNFVSECHTTPFRAGSGGNGSPEPLLTVVIPTYEPKSNDFTDLLLSLDQQTERNFRLIVVDDGSCDSVWNHRLESLQERPDTRVIRNERNLGVSATTNRGVEAASTPYVALVDQDDLLHPRAIELIDRTLRTSDRQTLFLYTDHIAFSADKTICQYIPKFPWNPEALAQFNYPIHLTVISKDLYERSGGLNSAYNGVQDWEFYLRISGELHSGNVHYIPLPLYFWRFHATSHAQSSRPRTELRKLAETFVQSFLDQRGYGEQIDQLRSPTEHYFFEITHSADPQTPSGDYRAVIHCASTTSSREIERTLNSLIAASRPPREVVLVACPSPCPGDGQEAWPFRVTKVGPESLGTLRRLPGGDLPALYLWAGICLEASSSIESHLHLLRNRKDIDIVSGAVFHEEEAICCHSGYYVFCRHEGRRVSFAYGQGTPQQDFIASFGSYTHRRLVDLPPPQGFLVSERYSAEFLQQLADSEQDAETHPRTNGGKERIFLRLGSSQRCLFVPDFTLTQQTPYLESPFWLHQEGEGKTLQLAGETIEPAALGLPASLNPESVNLAVRPRTYPHPLYFCRPWSDYLPADYVEANLTRLLQDRPRNAVVFVVPSELNPRSHGHACLLHLALDLQNAGAHVSLLPTTPYRFFRNYYQTLKPLYRSLRFITNPLEVPSESYLIVPESIRNFQVKSLRGYFAKVIWWNLAPAGVLTPFSPAIGRQDLVTFFSPFVLPNRPCYHFVNPPLPKRLRNLAKRHQPRRAASNTMLVYTGKGRLKPLSRKLHRHLLPYSIELITRTHPSSKEKLLELLMSAQGLISFDPMTNLSLEAALAGMPVFLPSTAFQEEAYAHFPVDLRGFLHTCSGEFLRHLTTQSPPRALVQKDLENAHRKSIDSFLLILADPVYAASFRCTEEVLEAISEYRRFLLASKTIQASLEGESVSSALKGLYMKTLKLPYTYHRALCVALSWIDGTADFLNSLRLFRPFRPIMRGLARLGRQLLKPVMQLGRKIPQ
jgi:hypothetical protein